MKKYLFLAVVLAAATGATSQNDGALDLTFNTTGIATFAPSASHDVVNDVAIQADQKIVGCGVVMSSTGFYNFDATVVRLHTDGSIDTDFGAYGYFTHDFFGEADYLYAVRVLDSGKILACGAASITVPDTDILLVRLNADGTPDDTFGGGDGFVIEQVGTGEDYAQSMVILADGSILICGSTAPAGFSTFHGLLMKFTADGEVDNSFGDNGKVVTDYNNESDKFYGMDLMDDGSIVACGETNSNFAPMGWLAKFDANGNPDLGFAFNGNLSGPANHHTAFDVVVDGDRIVVCGSVNYTANLYVYVVDEDGNFDATFSGDGMLQVDAGATDVALDILVQPDGKYLVAGSSGADVFSRDMLVVRLLPDGTGDTDFDTDGKAIYSLGSGFEDANAIALQADEKIVAAGFRSADNNDFAFIRLQNEFEVGVGEMAAAISLSIFPNPSSDFIALRAPGISTHEKIAVTVRDLTGRICMAQSQLMSENISLKNISPGTYLIEATGAGGGSYFGKVVVE